MSTEHYVAQLQEMKRALEAQHPNVLLVVGTGISFGATGDNRTTWRGLLEDGIRRLEALGAKKDSCNAALVLLRDAFTAVPFDLDEILQRAQSLTQELTKFGEMRFAEWLEDSIGAIKIAQNRRETIDVISGLERDGALLLTTNYDDVLCEATGLGPVTWQQPGEILKIINRQRKGIIHIHGHWKTPSSIIFGTNSYSRLVQTAVTQTVFKTLWMTLHWLYLGCGSGGVDDPNLGALFKWTRDSNLGESALTDFFLSTQQTIDALPTDFRESKNIVVCAYPRHDDLAKIMGSLRPEPKVSPFEVVGPYFTLVRDPAVSPLDHPFPSWQEFQDGLVPCLAADETVSKRLAIHGWAFVRDSASVGKTTLALRIAANVEYQKKSRLYLSLKRDFDNFEHADGGPSAAMARAKRAGAFIIIDDAHLNPRLAMRLWLQWRESPFVSRLLILATSMDRLLYLAGEDSLGRLEGDPTNPPIAVRANSQELVVIAKYVLERLHIDSWGVSPPETTTDDWRRRFSGELGAFVISISQCRDRLLIQDYSLPESAAQEWMWSRHLQKLSKSACTDLLCLAVFGQDDLELSVPEHCLPNQDLATRSQLLSSTLVARFVRKRAFHYTLREPGWAGLIRGALKPSPPIGMMMIDALEKDLEFTQIFVQALIEKQNRNLIEAFYSFIASDLDLLVRRILRGPLDGGAWFLATAKRQGHQTLTDHIWNALSSRPQQLAEQVLAARLEASSWFLAVAKEQQQQRLCGELWKFLSEHPERLMQRLFETSPEHVAHFLRLAETAHQTALVDFLWNKLALEPSRLFDWVLRSSPEHAARLIANAFDYGARNLLAGVWSEVDSNIKLVLEWLLAASMDHASRFLKITAALAPAVLVDRLWNALGQEPARLYDCAVQHSPSKVTSFIALAAARSETDLIKRFWDTAVCRMEPLALAWKNCTPAELAGLLHHVPEQYRAALVQGLDLRNMAMMKPDSNDRFFGAAHLAQTLFGVGRLDLAQLLVEKLFQRRETSDFGRPEFALKEMSRLLSIPIMSKSSIIDDFTKVICSKEFLSSAYKKSKPQDLINSLFDIAMHQPSFIISRFHHDGILVRLSALLREDDNIGLYFAIRLLGVSELIGLKYKPSALSHVSMEQISSAAKRLPNPNTSYKVRQCQQFWLGIHAATRLGRPICIDILVLERARKLWPSKLSAEPSSEDSESFKIGSLHTISVHMINWLGRCILASDRQLVEGDLNLGTLVGFPAE